MIGLGSYAFFWEHRAGLSLEDALVRTHELGVELFQICDFEPLDSMTASDLARIRATAHQLGITLELGTRGLGTDHLRRYLALADALDARLLRTMVTTTVTEAERLLDAISAELGDVTLALETYEHVPTRALVDLVARSGNPRVGICLDPANTVPLLEHPDDVIELARPWVSNVHVKDFAFSRREGWVGFTLAGCALGDGLLDIGHLLDVGSAQTTRIVEHWLPWQGDSATTVALEMDWTRRSIEYLRSH